MFPSPTTFPLLAKRVPLPSAEAEQRALVLIAANLLLDAGSDGETHHSFNVI
jgi:hypothetical protein